jgi:hypothetical protein
MNSSSMLLQTWSAVIGALGEAYCGAPQTVYVYVHLRKLLMRIACAETRVALTRGGIQMIAQTNTSSKVLTPLRIERMPGDAVQTAMKRLKVAEVEPCADVAYGCVEWFDYKRHPLKPPSPGREKN